MYNNNTFWGSPGVIYGELRYIYIIMCIDPCATCSANNFYSCLTCPSTAYTYTDSSLCIIRPNYYLHVASTCLLLIFVFPILLRKRGVVLVRILDYIQMAALFKLINGYTDMRSTWVYLGLRGWGYWEEGWDIISGDQTVPIWVNDEGVINKAIRVAAFWLFFTIIAIILGVIRSALDDKNMTFEKYMRMNIGNIFSYTFYYTLQDTSFIVATVLLNPTFTDTLHFVSFGLGIFFALFIIVVMCWCFSIINFPDPTEKYHRYKYFFLCAMDYDTFPTYSLLDLPKSSKQIKKYSNLRLLDMAKKIGFSFLIVGSLANSNISTQDQLMRIAAYILFFEAIFFIVMPFNIKKEYLHFILLIIALGLTYYLLLAPWTISSMIPHIIVLFTLFGLALISIILEYCLDIYRIVPVDLYGTGMKVVVEDPALLREIAQRRREQQQIEKRLKEMEAKNAELEKNLRDRQNNVNNKQSMNNTRKDFGELTEIDKRENSEASIANHQKPMAPEMEMEIKPDDLEEKLSMNSDELAGLYRIDELKRRKIYQWNKQQPFTYSNKMQ